MARFSKSEKKRQEGRLKPVNLTFGLSGRIISLFLLLLVVYLVLFATDYWTPLQFSLHHSRSLLSEASLTGSMFVSVCRNDSSLVFVQMLFCSGVARPENAAQMDDAANVDGGYIKNFSSERNK